MEKWKRLFVGGALIIAPFLPVIPEVFGKHEFRVKNVQHSEYSVYYEVAQSFVEQGRCEGHYATSTPVEPTNPNDDYLRNLRDGDVMMERSLKFNSLAGLVYQKFHPIGLNPFRLQLDSEGAEEYRRHSLAIELLYM